MTEERARILKLLEDGRITADQAARLIQALGAGRPESPEPPEPPSWAAHRRHRRVLVSELDRIPDIVAEVVSSAIRSGFDPTEKAKTDFPGKNSLFLKTVSGNVELVGWDKDRITLGDGSALLRARERDEQLMVRSISGDITGNVPAESRLEVASVSGDVTVSGVKGKFGLKSVSGDVSVTDFRGEVEITSVSGDVRLLRVSGRMRVESKSGDIKIVPSAEFEGEAVTRSGDIELWLGLGADVVLEMECEEDGDIEVEAELEHEVLEQTRRRSRVKFGSGARVMKLRTHRADITVRKAGEE